MHSMLAQAGHITLPRQLGGSPCVDKLATSKASCRPFVKATNRSGIGLACNGNKQLLVHNIDLLVVEQPADVLSMPVTARMRRAQRHFS